MGRIVRLTESDLKKIIKRVLKEEEVRPLTDDEKRLAVIDLQQSILKYELKQNIASFIQEPSGCEMPIDNDIIIYKQGVKNQCMIQGSLLCGGGKCYQNKAIDGIKGRNTINAINKYKDKDEQVKQDSEILGREIDKDSPDFAKSQVHNWKIPASMDSIKSFHHWIWYGPEYSLNAVNPDCNDNPNECIYNSQLCGGRPCKYVQAVDGSWGGNTKKLWNMWGQKYLKYRNVAFRYTDIKDQKDFRNETK